MEHQTQYTIGVICFTVIVLWTLIYGIPVPDPEIGQTLVTAGTFVHELRINSK